MKTTYLGLLSLAALASVTGCCMQSEASFPSQEELYDEPDAPDVLTVHSDNRSFSVKVDDANLVGPDVQLSIYSEPSDRAVRGSLWGHPVSVDVGENVALGAVGTTPFKLAVHREGGAVHASGSIQYRASDFTLARDRFTGKVADCRYDLHQTGSLTYEGERSCNGPGVPITMKIPNELSRWGDAGSAAAIALLLSES